MGKPTDKPKPPKYGRSHTLRMTMFWGNPRSLVPPRERLSFAASSENHSTISTPQSKLLTREAKEQAT
jgi:hypothetical protein